MQSLQVSCIKNLQFSDSDMENLIIHFFQNSDLSTQHHTLDVLRTEHRQQLKKFTYVLEYKPGWRSRGCHRVECTQKSFCKFCAESRPLFTVRFENKELNYEYDTVELCKNCIDCIYKCVEPSEKCQHSHECGFYFNAYHRTFRGKLYVQTCPNHLDDFQRFLKSLQK